MKKFIYLIGLCLFVLPFKVKALDVHIYLFYGNTCSICESEREFLNTLDNVKVHEYEVFDNENNYNMMVKIKEMYNIKKEGVPFTVVGDTSILGFNSSRENKIIKLVNKYQTVDYYDRVGVYLNLYEDEEIEEEIDNSLIIEDNNDYKDSSNSNINYIGIFIGVIIIIIILVFIIIFIKKRISDNHEK